MIIYVTRQARGILDVFLTHPGVELYGGQVATLAGVSPSTTSRLLSQMGEMGWLAVRVEHGAHMKGTKHWHRLTDEGVQAARDCVYAGATDRGGRRGDGPPRLPAQHPPIDDALRVADVAQLLGLKPAWITVLRRESRPGGKYADVPFPLQDGRDRAGPYWLRSRAEEIRQWDRVRPHTGVGPYLRRDS